MGDRIWKVGLGPYDQVIALTQFMINQGLQGQYDWAVKNGFVKPQTISLGRRYGDQGFYNAELGPPRVIIQYAPGDLSSILFRMQISKGQLRVYHSPPSVQDESVTSYKLVNFRLACPVNMGLQGLDEKSEDYQRIRKLMNKPGDYTIRQLLVDFENAQTRVLDEKTCDFGKWTAEDWILKNMDVPVPEVGAQPTSDYWRPQGWVEGQDRKLSEGELFNLKSAFNFALTGAVTRAMSGQLGFVAQARDLTGHKPTFTPSDVRFQTYPWTGTGASVGYEGTGRLNYLLYKEMVDGHTPPGMTDATSILQPVGNWTEGTEPNSQGIAEFGCYVLSKNNFLEKWFLPNLKKINRTMSCVYSSPDMRFAGNTNSWWCSFNFRIRVGDGCRSYDQVDSGDDKYGMSQWSTMPWRTQKMYDALPDDAKNAAFSSLRSGTLTWYYENAMEEDRTVWERHDHDWSNDCDSEAYSDCASRLSIYPGENKMVLEGFSRLRFGFFVSSTWGIKDDNRNYVTVTWKVTFTLVEVSDGGLAIEISEPETQYFWQKIASGWTSGGNNYDIKADLQERFDQGKTNCSNLVHDIKNGLQGNDKFYFPSRGRFFFKDPVFGHNGDLVVKCSYNGDETGTVNRDGIARDTSGVAPFETIGGMDPSGKRRGDKPK